MFHRLLAAAIVLTACAHVPSSRLPGPATLSGDVRLVPREGVAPGKRDEGPYADRRLRDVEFVDYRRPGFVVVYVEGPPVVAATARITIEPTLLGQRLEPPHLAVPAGGTLVVRNADAVAHTISCPPANLIRRLAPGEELALPAGPGGTLSFFLLDRPGMQTLVFVAPGPFTVASEDGQWELRDVPSGRWTIHAWHPRFPASEQPIEVGGGTARHMHLEIGVGNLDAHEATP